MSDGLMLYIDDDGVARAYDDTYDITIHCESEEEMQRAIEVINSRKWIPCSERLPIDEFEEGRKNGTVYDIYPCLVTRYSTHTDVPRTRTYVCKSYFDGEDFMLHGGYALDEGSDTENTLAWMPLPEPYKGDDK